MKFRINAELARRAFRRTVAYTGDQARPILDAVYVEADGSDHVRFTAADGFSLISTRVRATVEDAGDPFVITSEGVKALLKAIPGKARERSAATVTIERTAPSLACARIEDADGFADELDLVMDLAEVTYPNYRHLLPVDLPALDGSGDHQGGGPPIIGMNARLLARLADAGKLAESAIVRMLAPRSPSSPMAAVIIDVASPGAGDVIASASAVTVVLTMPMFVDHQISRDAYRLAISTPEREHAQAVAS